jgi:hypothetical protein
MRFGPTRFHALPKFAGSGGQACGDSESKFFMK